MEYSGLKAKRDYGLRHAGEGGTRFNLNPDQLDN